MITMAMIKSAEVTSDDSPFPNVARYRAGISFYAEEMVSKELPESIHDVAQLRLRGVVWNQMYLRLWIKVRRMETLIAQRRWADLEVMQKELDCMFQEAFNKTKLEE